MDGAAVSAPRQVHRLGDDNNNNNNDDDDDDDKAYEEAEKAEKDDGEVGEDDDDDDDADEEEERRRPLNQALRVRPVDPLIYLPCWRLVGTDGEHLFI